MTTDWECVCIYAFVNVRAMCQTTWAVFMGDVWMCCNALWDASSGRGYGNAGRACSRYDSSGHIIDPVGRLMEEEMMVCSSLFFLLFFSFFCFLFPCFSSLSISIYSSLSSFLHFLFVHRNIQYPVNISTHTLTHS